MYKTKSQIQPTNIYVPTDLLGWELDGVLQGNLVIRKSTVNIHTFDVIKVQFESVCEKTGNVFAHATAFLNGKQYFVILKQK